MKLLKILGLSFVLSAIFVATASAATFETDIQDGFLKKHSIATEHFRIEFSEIVRGQFDSDFDGIPDIIEIVAEAAEESWDEIVDGMRYIEPNPDLDSRLLVIIDDKAEYLAPGAIGLTGVLLTGNSFIVIYPWMSEDYLKITMAHEFYHAVQFAYVSDSSQSFHGLNLGESTATWVEDLIYDFVNDYVLYLPDYFNNADYSIFSAISPSDTLFPYALNIWPRFLSEYYDDGFMLDLWESYADSSTSIFNEFKVYDAYSDVIGAEGDDLGEIFQEFTLWNLDLDLYEEGHLYPDVTLLEGTENTTYLFNEAIYAPALYGTNYLFFENEVGDSDFYFHLVKPEGVRYGVSLVPYVNGIADLDDSVSMILDEYEEMKQEFVVSGLAVNQDVVAVLSPLDTDFSVDSDELIFDRGYEYLYLAQFGESLAAFVETSEPLGVDLGDEKEGDQVDPDDIRFENQLQLNIVDYDESSVIFSWQRLSNDEIAGYELYYGIEQGDPAFQLVIDTANITFAAVESLQEGTPYYFQLLAVDENGSQVGEASPEIAVTPEAWLFSDLSFLDPYYDSVSSLVEVGILTGDPVGTFRPYDTINRAEIVKTLVEARDITPDPLQYQNCFADVGSEWYAPYVCYAKEQNWIQGYDGNVFRPAQAVNKVEALKILFEVYEEALVEGTVVDELPYPDLSLDAWYSVYVSEAVELGILEEEAGTNFFAEADRLRGPMAEEVYRYLVGLGDLFKIPMF